MTRSPLRTSISLQVCAVLFSVIGVLGVGFLRGELNDRAAFQDARRLEANVIQSGAGGTIIEFQIDASVHRMLLDDRSSRRWAPGDKVAIEVPRSAPLRAVHRVGESDFTLPIILLALGLPLGVGCALAAWRLRRRCARRDAAPRSLSKRVVGAALDSALAIAFLLVWMAPSRLPSGFAEQAANALRFEAMLLVLMCFAVPFLLDRSSRIADAVIAGLVVLAGVLLANFVDQGEGGWTWGILVSLLLSRGWPLLDRDPARRLHHAERWAASLLSLMGTWWLCVGVLSWLPLPSPTGSLSPQQASELPGAATLLWGICHFSLQALMQWNDWPRPRSDQIDVSPRRA